MFSQSFIENFHFLRPWFLLGLIPAVALVLYLRYLRHSQSNWSKAIDASLLPFLLDKKGQPKQQLPYYGLLIIWVLSIVAMAGPVWQQIPSPVQEREDAMVIVLDLSLSMYSTDLAPNRLVRAQRKLIDVLNRRSDEGQTALVVYAGDAHAVTPLTNDVATINNMVMALEPGIMPLLGSNPRSGIAMALDLLTNSGLSEGQILLMTDGVNNTDVDAIASLMAGTGHRLSVLGIGTEEGAPIPMEGGGFLRDQQNAIVIPKLGRSLLQDLATVTGGRYADIVLSDQDIEYLTSQSIFEQNRNLVEASQQFDTWQETGPWLLLLVLPLAALAFRQGWLLSICLAVLIVPGKQAQAFEWSDLWKTRDQQASQAYQEENYGDAKRLFADQNWRAAAAYREGDYESALNDLAVQDNVNAHYNRGNVLARMQRLEEAITAYNAALEYEPDHADALQNREIVRNLLNQQNQQQEGQQSQDQQEQEQSAQQNQQEGEQSQQSQQGQEQQQSSEQNQAQNEEEQTSDEQGSSDMEESEQMAQAEGDEEDQEPPDAQASRSQQEAAAEEQQAMRQWLGRIDDDPGELLRNKFEYQTQQRLFERLQSPDLVEQGAQRQIW